MYFNVFVLSVVLYNFPACKSECSSFYILIQEYFDDALNVSSLKPVSENINWENYTIKFNNNDLKDFRKECVILLNCNEVQVNKCDSHVFTTKRFGFDESHIHPDTSTINTSTVTENNDPLTTTEKNANSTTIKKIINEIIESSTHETTDKTTIKINNETTDNTIGNSNYEITENTIGNSNNETTDNTIGNSNNETTDNTIGNSNNETTDKTIEDSHEVLDGFKINKTHESFTLGHVDGKPTGKPEDNAQHNKALAGKIAAGVVAAVVSVIATFAVKKYIMGCVQSGVYHMPAA